MPSPQIGWSDGIGIPSMRSGKELDHIGKLDAPDIILEFTSFVVLDYASELNATTKRTKRVKQLATHTTAKELAFLVSSTPRCDLHKLGRCILMTW